MGDGNSKREIFIITNKKANYEGQTVRSENNTWSIKKPSPTFIQAFNLCNYIVSIYRITITK